MDYEITPEEVKTKVDATEPFTLLDVREPWEFETARIDSAKLMPMGDVPRRIRNSIQRNTLL
jgi:rhodanese-related sulfurtransferase